jgi:hypothetical protein
MVVKILKNSGVRVLTPKWSPTRGSFVETYSPAAPRRAGIACEFVQDDQALSTRPCTIRGLHFRIPHDAPAKLVQVRLDGRLLLCAGARKGIVWDDPDLAIAWPVEPAGPSCRRTIIHRWISRTSVRQPVRAARRVDRPFGAAIRGRHYRARAGAGRGRPRCRRLCSTRSLTRR